MLFYWYQSYHWYQWRPFLSPLTPMESICEYWTTLVIWRGIAFFGLNKWVCGFQAGRDSKTGFTIYYSRLPITRHLLGKSKSWQSSSYREFKANNRKKETNEMRRRRSSSIIHTTLLGQQEICRYLERGIKQQSLINIYYQQGWTKKKQNKKTGRRRKRQRTHGWLEIK